jgi:putative ABC transport system permease protein
LGYSLGVFAALTLSLASVGIYGVMSYLVSQRTREIGVRMALGATTRDVLRMIVEQGLKRVVSGVALGVLGSLLLTLAIASLLFGISSTDPLTFAGVALLLTVIALLACFIPARRAARTDPMIALRRDRSDDRSGISLHT